MINSGFVFLWRILKNKPIWKKSTPEQCKILVTLLFMANYKDTECEWGGNKIILKPGQMITSLRSIKHECGDGISIKNVRTAIERFELLGFLTCESNKAGRLLTIINWNYYQNKLKGKDESPLKDSEVKEFEEQNNFNWQRGGKETGKANGRVNDKTNGKDESPLKDSEVKEFEEQNNFNWQSNWQSKRQSKRQSKWQINNNKLNKSKNVKEVCDEKPTLDILKDSFPEMEEVLIREAMQKGEGKDNPATYARAILRQWQDKGYKNLSDLSKQKEKAQHQVFDRRYSDPAYSDEELDKYYEVIE